MLKDMTLSFARNLSDKYGKQVFNTAAKTGINVSTKVICKAADARAKSYDKKIVKKTFN